MRVIVETEIFAASQDRGLALSALFYLGFLGRHRIQVTDSVASPFQQWLKKLSTLEQETIGLSADSGLSEDTSAPKGQTILVCNSGEPDWSASPPRLAIDDAITFLQRPFRVLLENSGNDSAFLLAFAMPETRLLLRGWEQKGWVVFENGGGITGIHKLVTAAIGKPNESFILWVLFDSDSLQPGVPSQQASSLAAICKGKLMYHQLKRRTMENYLPKEALDHWQKTAIKSKGATKEELYLAYTQLAPLQRHHYNMKSGFGGDAKRLDNAGTLYSALSPEDKKALAEGFGGSVAQLYQQLDFQRSWLVADGSTEEMNAALQQLLEKMR
jgi:hypothetical protein